MFLNYQIDYLLWLQNLREATNGFFNELFLSVTYFGEFLITVSFAALIYWCLNKKIGEFLIITYGFNLLLNQICKMFFCISRPWILSDKIKPVPEAIPEASGYSFPSGHTARAMSIWGGIAFKLWDVKKIRYAMIILILIVAFSRNYLGVHTPQDVIVSIILGIIVLFGLNKAFKLAENNQNFYIKIFGIGICLSAVSIAIVYLKYQYLSGQDLNEYITQIPSYSFNIGNVIGVFLGWFLCRKFIPFSTDNISIPKRIFRFAFGFIGLLFLIFIGNSAFVNDFGNIYGNFISAFIISLYVTFFYPWIFTRAERIIQLKEEKINNG